MRILGDSHITEADIIATNIATEALTEKLKTFQLTDNMRTLANNTLIDFTFEGTPPTMDFVALCGTSFTDTAVIELSYSDTDINSPEATITLTKFSTLNQIFFLDTAISKKYWRLSISDASLATLFIGYLYVGKYFQVPAVAFGHAPALELFSTPSVTLTGQGYGGKTYNAMPVDFTMYFDYDELVEYLAILQEKQDIDPVLLVEYENSYELVLYRPKYGSLVNTTNPYPMLEDPLVYQLAARLEERF